MRSDDDRTISQIRDGSADARESFIARHREFVRRCASFVCRRRLDWHDDELSVALIAFDRAIDSYIPGCHRSFLHYARRVIRNRLIDHFRTSGRATVSLDAAGPGLESALSWQRHRQDERGRERACEVARLTWQLGRHGLTVEDLVRASPSHRDTRERLQAAALAVSSDPTVRDRAWNGGRLPLTEIERLTGLSRKVLDRWRRYLLSLLIIAADPELEGLAEYVWGGRWPGHGASPGRCVGEPSPSRDRSD